MEILYIWVRDYKNLKNFELNLSSKIKFSYDPQKNVVTHTNLPDLPKNFFPAEISDVAALIGKNGSGKSNALELICNALKGSKSSILNDFFVVCRQEGGKKYIGYVRFGSLPAPKSRVISFQEHPGDIDPISVIFFSNVYDQRRNNFSDKVIDLSENSKAIFTPRPGYRWDFDFYKQIEFVNSEYFSSLGIQDPIAAQISVNVFNASWGARQIQIPSENLDALHNFIRRRTKDMQPKTRLVSICNYLYITGFLASYSGSMRNQKPTDNLMFDLDYEVQQIMEKFSSTEEILSAVVGEMRERCVKSGLLDSKKKDIFSHPRLTDGELLNRQFEFLADLSSIVADLDVEYSSDAIRSRSQQSFTVIYNSKSRNFLRKFAAYMSFIRFMNLDWIGLSSGEKAYLNLFSTLIAALPRAKDESIIMCIDEGDLYLHPKWQVDFLQRLLSILSEVSEAKIQLILTSHSPLLISDLPRQNIEILGGSDGLNKDLQTFGANLYDLYAGPLFLKNLTSGLFSTQKISEFMNILDTQKHNAPEQQYVNAFLSILGDKILKYKFEDIYKS